MTQVSTGAEKGLPTPEQLLFMPNLKNKTKLFQPYLVENPVPLDTNEQLFAITLWDSVIG